MTLASKIGNPCQPAGRRDSASSGEGVQKMDFIRYAANYVSMGTVFHQYSMIASFNQDLQQKCRAMIILHRVTLPNSSVEPSCLCPLHRRSDVGTLCLCPLCDLIYTISIPQLYDAAQLIIRFDYLLTDVLLIHRIVIIIFS